MLTNQEIYNKVRAHLLTQMKKSQLPSGMCAYRGEGGTSCAVGCLIEDEHYSASIENAPIYCVSERHNENLNALTRALVNSIGGYPSDSCIKLLGDLQQCHDRDDPENWEEHLGSSRRKTDWKYNAKQTADIQ